MLSPLVPPRRFELLRTLAHSSLSAARLPNSDTRATWCGREESNLHGIAPTTTSASLVFLSDTTALNQQFVSSCPFTHCVSRWRPIRVLTPYLPLDRRVCRSSTPIGHFGAAIRIERTLPDEVEECPVHHRGSGGDGGSRTHTGYCPLFLRQFRHTNCVRPHWCPRQESNLHTLRQPGLSRPCKPFHHSGKTGRA